MKYISTLRKTTQRVGSTLQQDLSNQIRRGSLPPGEALKSERQLATEYGISRVTVRRVLESLIEQGLLCRRYPVGTFVADPAGPNGEPGIRPTKARSGGKPARVSPYISLGQLCTLRFRISEPLRYQRRTWNRIVAEFHRQYPHINIEPDFDGVAPTGAAPEPPDILQVTNYGLSNQAGTIAAGHAEPTSELDPREYHSIASEALISAGAFRSLPFGIAVLCLFANERLFRECGVEPPDPVQPLGVMTYLKRAMALTEAARRKGDAEAWGYIHFGFVSLLLAMGLTLYDQRRQAFNFDCPAIQDAAARLLEHARRASPAAEVSVTSLHRWFREAKVGMMVRGTYEMPMYREVPGCRIGPAPIDPGGSYLGAILLNCVSRNSRYPEESWEFVRFLSSPPAQHLYASGGFNLPVLLEAQEAYFHHHGPDQAFLWEALARTRVFHGGLWAMDHFLSSAVEGEFWATLMENQPLEITLQKIQRAGERFLAQQDRTGKR